MEAEFGGPLSEELALWFIRNRIQREAIERMFGLNQEHQSERLVERAYSVVERRESLEGPLLARRKCA